MAPESDGILAHRVKQLNETGAENLNCSVEAITLAGDKYQTFLYLNRMDIPTPATMLLGDFLKAGQLTFPLVLKPRYGAGTSDTFYINDIGFLKNKASSILDLDQWIVQELKQGLPASYCFFVHKGQCTPIISSFQNMECLDLQFGYQGGSLPLPLDFEYRALILAQKTLLDFGGLNGWVGVDLILGQDTKGIKDFVFEINPRLTTSYLGARHHLLINPASLWAGNDLLLSQPESKGNNIVYYKNGTIEIKRGRTQ
jgi:predicted ATP-grasp superfamily ATP-dependent carboligase